MEANLLDKKNNLKLLLGISGLTAVAAMGWEHYRNHYNLDNHLSFAEKSIIFWQRRVYDQKIKFFIRLKAHNWNELLQNRDHFFVYIGTRNNPQCLSFAPRLSYAAQQAGKNVYYLDTTKEATNPILRHLLEDLQVKNPPALLCVDHGRIIRYDFDEKITDFINAH